MRDHNEETKEGKQRARARAPPNPVGFGPLSPSRERAPPEARKERARGTAPWRQGGRRCVRGWRIATRRSSRVNLSATMSLARDASRAVSPPRAERRGDGVVDWSSLPAELIGEVARASSTRDLLRALPGVCAAWRAQSRAQALGRLPLGLLGRGRRDESASLARLWRSARRASNVSDAEWEEDEVVLRSISPSFCYWLVFGSNLLATGQFEHEFWKVAVRLGERGWGRGSGTGD